MSSKPLSVQAVEEFIKLFQAVSTDPSFGHVHALVEENANLRVRNASLSTAFNESVNRVAQLQGQVETEGARTAAKVSELERATKNAADLAKTLSETEAKLKDKEDELRATSEGISDQQKKLNKKGLEVSTLQESLKQETSSTAKAKKAEKEARVELEKTKLELGANKTRLMELESFMFKCQRLSPENIKQKLRAIFDPAYSLMQKHFGNDLDSEALAESSRWDKIRNHNSIVRAIPVPSSNSPAAKNMRVAASLAILASALAEHVFRPIYLPENDNELSGLLFQLADEDYKKGKHLRSVLMGALPDNQKKNASQRAGNVVSNVFDCIGDVLSRGKQEQFKSALEELCQKTCLEWTELQHSAELIETELVFQPYERDNWKMLRLPQTEKSTPPQKARGGQPVSNNNATHSTENSSSLSANDFVVAVWPAFFTYVEGGSNLVDQGFVLGKSQMETARAEEASELSQGTRRAARQITRRNTIRNKVDKPNGKDFLSTGAGGSSGGG
ncbi:hypothetical protein EsH8_I_000307 [Colletotrichum jinshuiense]